MGTEHVIICGGTKPALDKSTETNVLPLDLWGHRSQNDIRLRIEDIHQPLLRNVPAQFQDLVEIATYVYCADQALSRGGVDVDTFGDNWRRRLHFHIPVRCPDLWQSKKLNRLLIETLEFLSDDFYQFSFHPAHRAPPFQQYLALPDPGAPPTPPESVIMYSGGLDSLGGAIRETVMEKRRVVLVNHRSSPKLNGRHNQLSALLAARAGEFRPIHVNVRINKDAELNKEYTQRTRSFLYASLGATVAQMLGIQGMKFYENGPVSMNLPVSAQVVGARATRTTHPRVIYGFRQILAEVAGAPFAIDNPFLWKTRADVIRLILEAGCGPLIASSTSCAHTWESTNQQTHCGTCSQCIDRRMGIIAANAEAYDPPGHYRTDVFTQSMPQDLDKMMVASYIERANRVTALRDVGEFISAYPMVARVLNYLADDPGQVAGRLFDLYRRHGEEVNTATRQMMVRHIEAIHKRTLPGDSLLRLVYETRAPISVPVTSPPATTPAVATIPSSEEPTNRPEWLFADEGATYRARTAQGEFTLPKRAGENYLFWFVRHPHQEIRSLSLVTQVRGPGLRKVSGDADEGDPDVAAQGGVPVDSVTTEDSLARLRRELREIKSERDKAENAGDTVRVSELDQEVESIRAQIAKDTNIFGESRTTSSDDKKAINSIRKEILRCCQRLREGKVQSEGRRALADHFQNCLSIGYMSQYRPITGIQWEVRER